MMNYKLPFVPENDREDIPGNAFGLKGPGFNYIPEHHGINYTHAYYAAIHFVDELVGKLIQELENEGLANNTIIVFTGDQGFHLGEHGHWHKSTLFEQGCRVPLIIVDPRQREKGMKCTNLTGLIDLYPTLCELTGIKAPHELSGMSLVPQLNDVTIPGKTHEITSLFGQYSIRSSKYRYSTWMDENTDKHFPMLYDLEQDPNELHNLTDTMEYQDIKKQLDETLRSKVFLD